jgi:hypothetical protein
MKLRKGGKGRVMSGGGGGREGKKVGRKQAKFPAALFLELGALVCGAPGAAREAPKEGPGR